MLQEIGFKTRNRFSLDDALKEGLIHNKEEFVVLFLEIGATSKTFLNEERLHELYERVNEAACFMTIIGQLLIFLTY